MAIDDSEGDATGVGEPAVSAETRPGGEASGGAAGGRNPTLESDRESVDDDLGTGDMSDSLESTDTVADRLSAVVDERTVRVNPDLDEDAFFTAENGGTTVVNRYDLERAVPQEKKSHFREVERYWVNEPYAFVIILHSEKENEKKYYLIEPHLSPIEEDLKEFLAKKLKTAIKYSSDRIVVQGSEDARAGVIERETHELLERYDLYDEGARPDDGGVLDGLKSAVGADDGSPDGTGGLQGVETRPEPAVLEEDPDTLTEYQIEKLLYLLKRTSSASSASTASNTTSTSRTSPVTATTPPCSSTTRTTNRSSRTFTTARRNWTTSW